MSRTLLWWAAAPAPPYTHDPRMREAALTNLAMDEAALLTLAAENRALLRAYINPPCVVLGLSRRLVQDVRAEVCYERGIPILRRASGGGTVYHDPFVVNFAWILPWSWLPGCDVRSLTDDATQRILDCLIDGLSEVGIVATRTRVSDLSVGRPPRKIVGSGQMRKRQGLMHHVSVLCDLDLATMAAVLPIPWDRPDIDHRDFVTSLRAKGYWSQTPWGHGSSSSHGWIRALTTLERAVLSATKSAFFADSEAISRADIAQCEAQARELITMKYGEESWIRRL